MPRFAKAGAILVLTIVLSGCSAHPKVVDLLAGNGAVTASPGMKQAVPPEYTFLEASRPARPSWTYETPPSSSRYQFLVGVSDYHASEKAARNDALGHACEQFAQYTGVDVSLVDQAIRATAGATSGVLDAFLTENSRSVQSTEARVSRVKGQSWYLRKYRVTQNGMYRGEAYKCFVKVEVPADEIDRVQTWQRRRDETRRKDRVRRKSEIEEELESQLKMDRRQLAEARSALERGDPVTVLNVLQGEWSRLDAVLGDWRKQGDSHAAGAQKLEEAKRCLVLRVDRVLSCLRLDTGRFPVSYAFPDAPPGPVPVWGWIELPQERPSMKNLPLVLKNEAGEILGRAVTDPRGRGDFHPESLPPGSYRVAIDTDNGLLADLNPTLLAALGKVENGVTILSSDGGMKRAIEAAVTGLFQGPSSVPLPVRQIFMGPVTYRNTGKGSELSLRLKTLLSERLTRIGGLEVVAPKHRNVGLVNRSIRTRGIDLKARALGEASVQAAIDGADSALEVSYDVSGEEIPLTLTLRKAGSDELLAVSSAVIAASAIPPGCHILPPTGNPVSKPETVRARAIRVDVSSNLGNDQTYQAGDAISYFVSTDRDAYLMMIYMDAANHLVQILPNRYSGKAFFPKGGYIQVPGVEADFRFVIRAPFGLEQVLTFAASRPFPELKGKVLANGLRLLDGSLKEILRELRTFGRRPGLFYGEAGTAVTTVPRAGQVARNDRN